jgi:PilZ domain
VRCLQSGLPISEPAKEFDGRIQNLSSGGACILCSYSLQPTSVVCCNFPVGDAPVSVPTLMRVRWTIKRGQKSPNYLSGFQFVF